MNIIEMLELDIELLESRLEHYMEEVAELKSPNTAYDFDPETFWNEREMDILKFSEDITPPMATVMDPTGGSESSSRFHKRLIGTYLHDLEYDDSRKIILGASWYSDPDIPKECGRLARVGDRVDIDGACYLVAGTNTSFSNDNDDATHFRAICELNWTPQYETS